MKTSSLILGIFLFTGISAQQNGNTKPAPPHTATLKIADDKKNAKDTVDHSKKMPAPDKTIKN
jgi:hypothetical protein